jgi:hypothetical protein
VRLLGKNEDLALESTESHPARHFPASSEDRLSSVRWLELEQRWEQLSTSLQDRRQTAQLKQRVADLEAQIVFLIRDLRLTRQQHPGSQPQPCDGEGNNDNIMAVVHAVENHGDLKKIQRRENGMPSEMCERLWASEDETALLKRKVLQLETAAERNRTYLPPHTGAPSLCARVHMLACSQSSITQLFWSRCSIPNDCPLLTQL